MGEKKEFQLGNILTISFGHLFHDIYSSFLAPILPLLITKLSISYSMAGLLDVTRKIPSFMNPLIGLIADRICVRYFIILAPAITAIVMSLLGIANHYTVLLILLFIMGISSTLFHVPGPVMVKHISGNKVGKGMSFYMLGGELARTLGPLIILGAVSLWGLEGTYRLIPFGILASIFLFFKLKKIQINKDFQNRKKEWGVSQTFLKFLPLFLTLAGITFFRAMMMAALTIFLPTYLNMKGETIWFAGISLSILQFSGAVGTLLAGSLSDKIGRKNSLLIIVIVNPLLMWIFVTCNGLWIIPLLIIMGFFLFAIRPVLLALVQDTNSEYPAFINGIYMTINFLISSTTVMMIGFIGDKLGLDFTYKLAAFLALGSIPFVLLLSKKNILYIRRKL
jgi:FSR family fosmidomycin resistance protein-like MFS transporter